MAPSLHNRRRIANGLVIAEADVRIWDRRAIESCQISGVFLFGRWQGSSNRVLMELILRAWAEQ